jgi:hypothetical protein
VGFNYWDNYYFKKEKETVGEREGKNKAQPRASVFSESTRKWTQGLGGLRAERPPGLSL